MPPRRAKVVAQSVSFLGLVDNKAQLVEALRNFHGELKVLHQDVFLLSEENKLKCQELINKKLSDHPDKEVRLLLGCCFTEVLRIYAPEAPYSDNEMLRVFQLLIAQIRGLETHNIDSSQGSLMLQILHSLAEVKSCVVPILLVQQGVEQAQEVVQSLFDVMITILRPDSPEEVYKFSMEVLHICINEYEGVTEDLLDILLLPLLPTNKKDNPVAYKVVGVVLRACAGLVRRTLSKVINDILVSATNRDEHMHSMEISEEIYAILFELHKISPELLLDIVPILSLQLKVEEEEIRIKAVKILTKLYVSTHYDYAEAFPREFKEFQGRLNDQSGTIRLEVLDACMGLLKDKPQLIELLEENIVKRVRDPEEDVRSKALSTLLSFSHHDISSLNTSSYKAICDRLVDRKLEIRKAALVGLAKLYNKYITNHVVSFKEAKHDIDNVVLNIKGEIVERVGNVPSLIIKSWGFPDIITKHLVVMLLQEYIFNVKSDDEAESADLKASMVLYVYYHLEEADRTGLAAILSFKYRIREDLSSFLEMRSSNLEKSKEYMQRITQSIPIVEQKKGLSLDKIFSNKDKFVYRLLQACTAYNLTMDTAMTNREDLLKRLDSKSILAEYVHIMYDFACPSLFVNQSMLNTMLESMATSSILGEVSSIVCDMTAMLAQTQPRLLATGSNELINWLKYSLPAEAMSEKNKLYAIKMHSLEKWVMAMKHCVRYIGESGVVENIVKVGIDYLKSTSNITVGGKLAEVLATVCLLHTMDTLRTVLSDRVSKFVKELCKRESLSMSNARLPTTLVILNSLVTIPHLAYQNLSIMQISAQHMASILSTIRTNVLQFLLHTALPSSNASIQIKTLSLCLLTTLLCTEEECKQIQETVEQRTIRSPTPKPRLSLNPTLGSSEFDIGVQTLFECIEQGGKKLYGEDIKLTIDQREAYKAAALCLVQLMKVKKFADEIEAGQWQDFAWAFIADDLSTRRELLQSIQGVMVYHQVHPRFLCYLCLYANDNNDMAESAQGLLVTAIKKLRKTHDDIGLRLLSVRDDDERTRYHSMAAITMPEITLPYLLYLLSYHPQFPTSVKMDSEHDKKGMKYMVKCLQSLLNALQSSLRNSSNLPFLFKQLNTIAQKCVDKYDENNIGIHFVTRLAVKLLSEQIKTADNVQTYPGDIILPLELFAYKPSGDMQRALASSVIATTGATNGLDEAEIAIRQAIQLAGKKTSSKVVASTPVIGGEAAGGNMKSPPSSGKKKRKKSLSPVDESTDIEDDEEERISKKRRAPAKKEKILPAEMPTRNVPRRGAKGAVTSYEEKEESDREVEEWNDEAGRQQRRSSTGSRGRERSREVEREEMQEEEKEVSPIKDTGSDVDIFEEPLMEMEETSFLMKRKSSSSVFKEIEKRVSRERGRESGGTDEDLPSDDNVATKKKKTKKAGKSAKEQEAAAEEEKQEAPKPDIHSKRRKALQDVSDNIFIESQPAIPSPTLKATGSKGSKEKTNEEEKASVKENIAEGKVTRSRRAKA